VVSGLLQRLQVVECHRVETENVVAIDVDEQPFAAELEYVEGRAIAIV
jgi:hypothetical protein